MVIFSQEKDISSVFVCFIISTFLLLSGCASNEVIEADAEPVAVVEEVEEDTEIDPYEGFNRKVFVFNETLDDWVAAPVSDAYLWVTP